MKLLLTGATGFVGRNVLLRALDEWEEIFVPVRDERKLQAQLAAERVSTGKIRPLPADPAKWSGINPTHAIHCAGVLFARSREQYFQTNVDWTLSVLRALPADCRTVILSSLSAGGPTPQGRAARRESDPDEPITLYGRSKKEMETRVAAELADRPMVILRPPMILGARDTATLPLFKMAKGRLRTKPGLKLKFYSFIAVDDLVEAIRRAFPLPSRGPWYVASGETIADADLIRYAGDACGVKGRSIAIPQPLIQGLSLIVDSVPSLRTAIPSLTRDRARELWQDRWVVDASAFESQTGWKARIPPGEAMQSAYDYYKGQGVV